VEHEPAEGSFNYPAPFQDVESAGPAFPRDDFHVDAEGGAVLDGGVLEAAVRPGLGNRGVVVLRLAEEPYPMALSDRLAAVTVTARIRPSASVMTPRFRPAIFFPASAPWLVTGTFVEVLMLWVSMTAAVGSGARPSFTRAIPVSS
jgi:hypothetical protein